MVISWILRYSTHNRSDLSFFFTNSTGAPSGDELDLMNPFHRFSSRYPVESPTLFETSYRAGCKRGSFLPARVSGDRKLDGGGVPWLIVHLTGPGIRGIQGESVPSNLQLRGCCLLLY